MKSYACMVLGCKVNDYEATYIKNEMNKYYRQVSFKEQADIYIIFTCCVTNTAEAKTRKYLHKAKSLNPNSFVVAIGCLSQIKGSSDDFKDVDLIIGSSHKDEVVKLITEGLKSNKVEDLTEAQFEDLSIDDYPDKSRAFLKIQDGCNQYCSYCIIPYSRGHERSLNHEIVLRNAEVLSHKFKEIVLTGIHTGRYYDGKYNLYMLLKDLVNIDGLETIRLSSIELNEVTDEIIELIKKSNGKIAHHLHIPVQALSNEILSLMHRPYTLEDFISRIAYIRSEIPDISISTDLIVGFPGETDEIFNNSLKALEEIKFSFIHCFPYSRKKGTLADKMPNHLDENIKKQRLHTIEKCELNYTRAFSNSFINKEVSVLIEKNEDGYSYGYCKQYFYVTIKGNYEIGKIVKAQIISVLDDKIIGEYVS